MFSSVFNDCIQRTSEFCLDSVNLTAKTSDPRKDKELPRKSSTSLELVVVTMAGIFEQPSCKISDIFQPATIFGYAGRSTLRCRRTRNGHKWASGV